MATGIETVFEEAIQAGKIHGAVLCATNRKGDFVYQHTPGERTLLSGEKRPQQFDDVLFLASATKLLTTIAALQCVEDGLLTLDGDLSSIAPELAAKQVLTGFSEDGESAVLEPQSQAITLEMLLTHSSGIVYDFLDPRISQWRAKFNPFVLGSPRTVETSFDYPLAFQPGTGWNYGPGADWAGRIVERVTGLRLGEHMQRRICDPLGINSAQFYPVTRPELRERLVNLNPEDPEALGLAVMGGPGDVNSGSQGDFGGQGMFMAGDDFIKVMHSLLLNDGKLVGEEMGEAMFKQHLSPVAEATHRAIMDGPFGEIVRLGLPKGTKAGFGLGGFLVMEDIEGLYGDGSMSWGGGVTLNWAIDRKNDLCGLVAVQSKLPVDIGLMTQLMDAFKKDIYRKQAAWKKNQEEAAL